MEDHEREDSLAEVPFEVEATEVVDEPPKATEECAEEVIARLSARVAELEAAEAARARQAARSAGLPGAAASNYYTPSQVRAMSRREVHDNYDRICESMRHWQ